MNVVILPNQRQWQTAQALLERGFMISTIRTRRGKQRNIVTLDCVVIRRDWSKKKHETYFMPDSRPDPDGVR